MLTRIKERFADELPLWHCGGPGSADSAIACVLVFEDMLEVAPNIELETSSPNSVYVSFGLHNERMDACLFRGQGTWSNRRLWLARGETQTDQGCRLSVSFSKGTARLSDPGGSAGRAFVSEPEES